MMKKLHLLMDRYRKLSLLNRFIVNGILLYMLYFNLNYLLTSVAFFKPVLMLLQNWFTAFYITITDWSLNLLGYDVERNNNIIKISGSNGIRIIRGCLGWKTMILFGGFILALPGAVKAKLKFIAMGLVIIIGLNSLRLTGTAIISHCCVQYMLFYHTYTFRMILFVAIFILWMIWINKNYAISEKEIHSK